MVFIFYLFFFFLTKTEIIIATNITAIIAINPGQPKIATNLLPKDIIIPARITPRATALTLVLKSKFKKLAANVPVQAPVPGSGIPTKSNNAKKIPLFPAVSFNFFPPFSPFSKHHVKNLPIIFFIFSPFKNFSCK